MFYKIENQDSKVFHKLKELREKENAIEDLNKRLIEEKAGQKFEVFLGHPYQRGTCRTSQYTAIEFDKPDHLCSKTWKKNKDHPTCYEPNRRTKKGREFDEFIRNLETTHYTQIFDILKLDHIINGRFTIPFLEYLDNKIIMRLDDRHQPNDENIIEITSKEFEQTLNKSRS